MTFPIIDQDQTQKQLIALGYTDADKIALRCIHHARFRGESSPRNSALKGVGGGYSLGELDYAKLEQRQDQGYEVYIAVNGAHKDKEVSQCRAVFYEHDDLDKSISAALWQSLGLPEPTLQIDTGGKSIHSYWVFNTPIPVEDWKKLQTDLLDFADADRSLKNPSRIMRLAGGWHLKSGTPVMSTVVSCSGVRYGFEELRAKVIVDDPVAPEPPSLPRFISGAIPLERCIAKLNRGLVEDGCQEGERNSLGFALACDLIGTADQLTYLGHQVDGDPHQLFLEYCQRCPAGNGWNEKEWSNIWKSASSSNPKPSLSADKLQACIEKVVREQRLGESRQSTQTQNGQKAESANEPEEENKNSRPPALTREDLVEKVRLIRKMGDAVDQWFAWSDLGKQSGFNKRELLDLSLAVESRRSFAPQDGLAFIANTPDHFPYLIDSIIVLGVNLLIYADSGIGKSLLFYHIAKAVATGSYWNGFEVQQGQVLIIQTDEPSVVSKRRLKRMGFDKTKPGSWYIEQNWQFSQIGQLEDWIIEYQPKFVMVDCLTTSNRSSASDENDVSYSLVQNDLMKLADKYQCTIATLHHENKTGGSRGSTGLTAHTSEVWHLKKPDASEMQAHQLNEEQHRVLEVKKSRTDFMGKHLLEFEPEAYEWTYRGELNEELNKQPKGQKETARAVIIRYLKEQNETSWYSTENITEAVGKSSSYVRKELTKLYDQGVVDRQAEEQEGADGRRKWFSFYRYARVSDSQEKKDQQQNLDADTVIAAPHPDPQPGLFEKGSATNPKGSEIDKRALEVQGEKTANGRMGVIADPFSEGSATNQKGSATRSSYNPLPDVDALPDPFSTGVTHTRDDLPAPEKEEWI